MSGTCSFTTLFQYHSKKMRRKVKKLKNHSNEWFFNFVEVAGIEPASESGYESESTTRSERYL